jgi:hypothetical protein
MTIGRWPEWSTTAARERKLVAPDWGKRLVTEITKADVEKLLTKIAAGRARPSKEKPNNRARKLQGAKPTPVRANRVGEVLRKMFTLAIGWGMARPTILPAGFRRRIENTARTLPDARGDRAAGQGAGCGQGSARGRDHPALHADRRAVGRGAPGAV